jgi:hypothetical protein
MKKFYFLILIIWLNPSMGQNIITFGNKSYPCSETYELKDNAETLSFNGLYVIFSKGDISNMLILEHKEPFSCLTIKGWVTIVLDDGTILKLALNGLNDFVDGKTIMGYYLEKSDIIKLEHSNINYIRYAVKGITCGGREQEGDFTASNPKDKKIDFPSIINAFF